MAYLLKDQLLKLLIDVMTCFVTRGQIMTHRDMFYIDVLAAVHCTLKIYLILIT